MAEAVIIDSVRTGLAKSFRGGFNQTRADDMTAHIIDALMDRNPKVEPGLVEDVILGCGYPDGPQGNNIARTSAVLSKLPIQTAGTTVNRYCSSGLTTIAMAATQIQSGFADCITFASWSNFCWSSIFIHGIGIVCCCGSWRVCVYHNRHIGILIGQVDDVHSCLSFL